MIKSYFKTAWRSLLKNKVMSCLNIAGLTVGMTAAVLIFMWVQNEMSFDGFHPDADRIYRLTTRTTDKKWTWEGSPMLLAGAIVKETPGIETTSRIFADKWPVFEVKGIPQYEKQCAYVDNNWFDLFHYHFIEGNAAGFTRNPNSVILTAAAAKGYFGGREAIGQTVRIDSLNCVVRAVVEDAPTNSTFQYRMFVPIAALMTDRQVRENGENWSNTDYRTFIKFAPGVNVAAANKKLTEVLQKHSYDDNHAIAAGIVNLRDMHFENHLDGAMFKHGDIHAVYIFSLLGFLLLLVACINYVNLTTAKASLRSKEVSIRKVVGAARRQLFYQFIVESLLVSLLSLGATLLLIWICLPAFDGLTEKEFVFPLSSLALWKVLGSTLLMAFLLNSLYPALLLSSFKPLNVFRGVTILKVKDAYFRKGLVVLQFSISISLITATIVIYRQMQFIQKNNPGYDKSQVLNVTLPQNLHLDNNPQLIEAIKQELLTHAAIENVSMVNQPVISISSSTTGADWDGRDTAFTPKVNQLSTDADLLKTMHLQMAAGRWFEKTGGMDKQNFILNETAVRQLNIRTPVLGQRFSMHGKTGRIIGVVQDFRYRNMHDKIGSLVIFDDPGWWNFFQIRTAPLNAAAAVRAVEDIWKKMVPGIPLEYSFLDDRFDELYKQDRQASVLIFVFAVIAVIISALGLFGLSAFAAEQRTKELGIRKILGATLGNIGMLLSKEFVKLIAVAIIIATPLAWWAMNKWLEDFAYRIEIGWWAPVSAGALALLIALAITSYHTIRASVANPVRSLRILSLILVFASGIFLEACGQSAPVMTAAEREKAVENGLVGVVQIEGQSPSTIGGRMADYGIRSVSVAVIHHYAIDWAKGYGCSERTLFQAASISKSLNAVGVLKLVQEGRLDLYTDINQYLKSWTFPYDSLAKGKKITVAELLSHTAGLSVHGFPGYERGTSLPSLEQMLDGKPPANSPAIRSMFEPGLRSEYSGGGVTIAKQIVMDITHEDYARFMDEQVLKPFGMTSSSYEQPYTRIDSTLLATAYDGEGKEIPGKYHIYPEQAADGLWTNPTELAKYIIAMQLALDGKSEKVLNQQTARLMLTPYLDQSAALGVFINDFNGVKYFQHGGANEGFRSQYYGSMEGGEAVVVMVNSDNGAIMNEIINSVAKVYDMKGLARTIVRKQVEIGDTALLQAYAGQYQLYADFKVTITRVGTKLFAHPSGQPVYPIYAEAPNKFFFTIVNGEIEFVKDETGKIFKAIFYQDGTSHDGKKID
jgi:putative ABC transport system permease protein